jgi:hypothetical protein
MKIRSLLLGSIAAAGLATSGFAADLGVVTSLDICDELGLSGLTISSDDNCLQISGGVDVSYKIGNYEPGVVYAAFARKGFTSTYTVDDNVGPMDSKVDIDVWLQFVATANSDFGPATATIKLLKEDYPGTGDFILYVDKAWVGIGDTTQLMAGKKSSIFNDGDDAPLNYLGLFNSSDVDAGVGFSTVAPSTGGVVIQVSHNLGNGLVISGGIENLQTSSPPIITGVGTLAYTGDGISAHASGAINQVGAWKTHAGFKATWDPITVVGAIAANNGWWNALGSASATFDMFTLAVSGEATSAAEWGVGASASATVSDGVTINLGGRFFNGVGANDVWQGEAGVSAAVTETITLTAAIGAVDSALDPFVIYGKAGLAWNPGGGFTSSIEGKAQSNGAYSATFKAGKTIK